MNEDRVSVNEPNEEKTFEYEKKPGKVSAIVLEALNAKEAVNWRDVFMKWYDLRVKHGWITEWKPLLEKAIPFQSDPTKRCNFMQRYTGPPLPASVFNFLSRVEIDALILRCYPTGIRITGGSGSRSQELAINPLYEHHPLAPWGRQHVLRVIDEGQGCFYLWVCWNDGELDPPVFFADASHVGELTNAQELLSCHVKIAEREKRNLENKNQADEEEMESYRLMLKEIEERRLVVDKLSRLTEKENLEKFFDSFQLAFNHFSDCIEHFFRDGEIWYNQHGGSRLDMLASEMIGEGQKRTRPTTTTKHRFAA